MFGLTTALKLHEAGKKTAVLEAHRVGMGVGGFSSAKLCSLQRNSFGIIQSKHGDDMVKSYGRMSQEGTPLPPVATAAQAGMDLTRAFRVICSH